MELREITLLAVALRILVSIVIGGLIGLERGLTPSRMRSATQARRLWSQSTTWRS